jgi:anti-anti-sigma factor
LVESHSSDRLVRIQLIGELDLAGAAQFSRRVAELVGERVRVKLDLSRLEFIDSTGLHALMRAVIDGHAEDGQLVEVGTELRPCVRSTIDLVGAACVIWPAGVVLDEQQPG